MVALVGGKTARPCVGEREPLCPMHSGHISCRETVRLASSGLTGKALVVEP